MPSEPSGQISKSKTPLHVQSMCPLFKHCSDPSHDDMCGRNCFTFRWTAPTAPFLERIAGESTNSKFALKSFSMKRSIRDNCACFISFACRDVVPSHTAPPEPPNQKTAVPDKFNIQQATQHHHPFAVEVLGQTFCGVGRARDPLDLELFQVQPEVLDLLVFAGSTLAAEKQAVCCSSVCPDAYFSFVPKFTNHVGLSEGFARTAHQS